MEPNHTSAVAAELRAAMARSRVSARELARELQVSHMWVNRRLNGNTDLTLRDVERIARALGRDPQDVYAAAAREVSAS